MFVAATPTPIVACIQRWNSAGNAAARHELFRLDKKPTVFGRLDHVRISVRARTCDYRVYGRFGDADFLLTPGKAPFWFSGISTAPFKDSPLGRYGPGNARRLSGGRFALRA